MQQRSCQPIQLILSRYVDGEATEAERARVRSHLALCEDCSRKLADYTEMAAIFSDAAPRSPEPRLRADLFREIGDLRQAEHLKARNERNRAAWLPQTPARPERRGLHRILPAGNPLTVAILAICAFLGLAFVFSTPAPKKTALPVQADLPFDQPVPTLAARVGDNDTLDNAVGVGAVPPAVSTKIGGVLSPVVAVSATAYATSVGEGFFPLSHPTPILEEGDTSSLAGWHTMRDPVYGYSVQYPPNWWTYLSSHGRVFVPWGMSGTLNAPYWMEMRVEPNTAGLTTENANALRFHGKASVVLNKRGNPMWVRYISQDAANKYDEIYAFSASSVYILRLTVPRNSSLGDTNRRLRDAGALFSKMSGTFALSLQHVTAGYAPLLFLNGSDLYMLEPDMQVRSITRGYGVRQFALSPDMRTVAFTSAKNSSDLWAGALYVLHVDGDSVDNPTLLWEGAAQVHDVAWYGDRELVAIGQDRKEGFGLFRLSVPTAKTPPGEESSFSVVRIAPLADSMLGAKGLAVSPDRQLITFLAPIGESMGTDIYALRPDGTDMGVMISHADVTAPSDASGLILTADSQAIKSYTWTDGRLEPGGYRFHILLTCGNSASPTFYRGGFLYLAPGATNHVLLDQNALDIPDATRMQVVHLAYGNNGNLAFTGYYNDRDGRADLLAGIWTARVTQSGTLAEVRAQPIPERPHGVTDLQWSPDGNSLVYRETEPQDAESASSRYDGRSQSPFSIVKLNPATGERTILFTSR